MDLSILFAERARNVLPPMWGPEPESDIPLISLAYGLADPAFFPHEELVHAAVETFGTDLDGALNYGPNYAGLISVVAERLRRQGITAVEEQIMLGYGSSQILGLLPQVLVDPGDTVIVEAPTFLGAVNRFRMAGATLVGVPVDSQGMNVAALEAILADLFQRNIRPKFIYTIPTFQNPTGATLSLDRRQRLVDLAAEYGILLVEDDAYSSLSFAGEPPPPLASLDKAGVVLYVSTFSKILAPGLRMGWAHGPKELIDRLLMFKVEGSSGPFLTQMIARYAANGRLDQHISTLRTAYAARCDLMLRAIAREIPNAQVVEPSGGFFIWLRLPDGIQAGNLVPVAFRHGVEVLAGPRCFADGSGEEYIRLAFSYEPLPKLEAAIERLGAAIRELAAAAQ